MIKKRKKKPTHKKRNKTQGSLERMKLEYEKPWQEVLGEKGGPEQKFLVALPAKFLAGTILPHKGPPCHHLRVRLRGALLVRGSGHPAITNTPKNPQNTQKPQQGSLPTPPAVFLWQTPVWQSGLMRDSWAGGSRTGVHT